ncbi:MAG TPA: hypothetical protein VGG10_15010 [Rhizomicrobium sp.]
MGKRGPKPKPREDVRPSPTGVRLSPELREQLENAAAENGQSLSREIENRLAASFSNDKYNRVVKLFGGEKTFGLAWLIAIALKKLRLQTWHSWHEDAYTFEQAKSAVLKIMTSLRPEGDSSRPPDDMPLYAQVVAKGHSEASAVDLLRSLEIGEWVADTALHFTRYIDSPFGFEDVESGRAMVQDTDSRTQIEARRSATGDPNDEQEWLEELENLRAVGLQLGGMVKRRAPTAVPKKAKSR